MPVILVEGPIDGADARSISEPRGVLLLGGHISDDRVLKALDYMDANYHLPITRNDVALHLALSVSRLHTLFRMTTNTTPNKAILTLKMAKAAEFLRTTDLLVKQVMARVAIQDESHFVRTFKKMFHFTPTEYRETHPIQAAGPGAQH